MELSILIATMPSRKDMLNALLETLTIQVDKDIVEIIIDDSTDYNIGVKRNKLLDKATGDYIVFIDDDDHIPPYYVEKILEALSSRPDCIGMTGVITLNGKNLKRWYISKSYGIWFEEKNIYYRTTNHISPVKRELALKARFPDVPFGEDYVYSVSLLPFLKTEIIIPEDLYHYDYRDK